MTKEELKDLFTDMISRKLEESWEKPWFSPLTAFSAVTNYKSGKQYRNGNFFFLMMASMFENFSTMQFMTYKQAFSLGYMVKKGSKGLPVYYYNFKYYRMVGDKRINLPAKEFENLTIQQLKDQGISRLPYIKIYHVFNVSQLINMETNETLEAEILNKHFDEVGLEKINRNPEEIIPSCENLINEWECPINFVKGADRCYYAPGNDYIQLVDRLQFVDNESFFNL